MDFRAASPPPGDAAPGLPIGLPYERRPAQSTEQLRRARREAARRERLEAERRARAAAAAEARLDGRQALLRRWGVPASGWTTSLLLHAAGAIILALIVFGRGDAGPPALTGWLQDHPEPAVEFAPPLQLAQNDPQAGGNENPLESLEKDSGEATPNGLIPLDAVLGGGEPGKGSGAGGIDGIGFFGAKGSGRSVVFVVDRSFSMQGPRLARAQGELRKSINNLKNDQKFCIVFFNDRAHMMFGTSTRSGLVAGTAANKRRALRWMGEIDAVGSTVPAEALRQAFALEPDVIFFLTDGEIPLDTPELVRRLNEQNKTAVHTIALQGTGGEFLLKLIAEANRGTYRYVK